MTLRSGDPRQRVRCHAHQKIAVDLSGLNHEATFNADVTNPRAYDLVINTAQIPLAQAADLLCAHVRSRTLALSS